MATYAEIQERVRANGYPTPMTGWIAHVKEMNNLPLRRAPNRQGEIRQCPCPPRMIAPIEQAFREFRMIP